MLLYLIELSIIYTYHCNRLEYRYVIIYYLPICRYSSLIPVPVWTYKRPNQNLTLGPLIFWNVVAIWRKGVFLISLYLFHLYYTTGTILKQMARFVVTIIEMLGRFYRTVRCSWKAAARRGKKDLGISRVRFLYRARGSLCRNRWVILKVILLFNLGSNLDCILEVLIRNNLIIIIINKSHL